MKRGFTIIELLVASLLLGMLVTILTMIFNQSSIAWRTGMAGITDLDKVRNQIGQWRDEADNVFIANNEPHRILSPWLNGRTLRTRACDVDYNTEKAALFQGLLNDSTKLSSLGSVSVGSARGGSGGANYIVNVMSAGPDKEFDTWDDIWSWPDEFE